MGRAITDRPTCYEHVEQKYVVTDDCLCLCLEDEEANGEVEGLIQKYLKEIEELRYCVGANKLSSTQAGLHVRRKHKRPFIFLALVLASSRLTRGSSLCLGRTCKPALTACLTGSLLNWFIPVFRGLQNAVSLVLLVWTLLVW